MKRFLVLLACPLSALAAEFMAGGDVSHLGFFEDRGAVYREDGRVGDALQILRHRGLNWARLRLFTSSPAQAQADPYNRTNNLEYTIPLAVRARRAGLRVLLDIHYSDTWADPGKQTKPAAWTNLTSAQLEQRMYEYTRDAIAAFRAAGAPPECVQVGNEITGGLLWPEGRVGGAYDNPAQWSQLGRLLQAAIRGVKEAAGSPLPALMIHIDRGGDWAGTQWFFDNLRQQPVEFDLIGLSYYPFWHGSLGALQNCLTNAASRYAKPVVLAETAFPWTNSADVVGLPATPDGQARFVAGLAAILKAVPAGRGAGVFWWGTEYRPVPGAGTAGFQFRSLFGADGGVLPAADALGQLAAPVRLSAWVEGEGVTVSWPLSGAGLSLAGATGLPLPAWWPSSNAVRSSGTSFSATLPAEGQARFLRLQSD